MPSRPLPPPSPHPHLHSKTLILAASAAASATFLLLLSLLLVLLYLCFFHRRRSPTLPFPPPPTPPPLPLTLRRFSYRSLRLATRSFDPSLSLGRGASASVFRAALPIPSKSLAVKLLDPLSSPTADLEFQNELHVLSSLPPSPFIVPLLGYSLSRRRRRRVLVYEYMPNGSLQEALFGSPPPFDLGWDRRFQIIADVAQALNFLHSQCDPPVVHGDIKPSNVLLDSEFRAKVSDFGLARVKSNDPDDSAADFLFSQELGIGIGPGQEILSPQVDFALAIQASKGFSGSPKGKEAALATTTGDCEEEAGSVELSKELNGNLDEKDWWWKQEESGELCSKDYVQEWIGSQICPSANPDWDDSPEKLEDEGKRRRSVDATGEKKKRKLIREWWKEEYFAEISNKGKCKNTGMKLFKTSNSSPGVETCCSSNDADKGRSLNTEISFRKGWKTKKKRTPSIGSEMWSGDLYSKELSSTTSMRGTICYVAPEFGGCGHLMEKADIYSFGVLVLVVVSGRRPLHVLPSPMKLERANLISWCRQLATSGNVLELVDERMKESYNKEQASLCINLALSCLQKLPELRPDSGDIVRILRGEMEVPVVPFDFSPSPNSRVFSRSKRKTTKSDADPCGM